MCILVEDDEKAKEDISNIAKKFEESNYNLKTLFSVTASTCLGGDSMKISILLSVASLVLSCSAENSNKRQARKSVVEQNSDEQVAEDPFKLAGASVKNCDRFLSTASKITGLKLADPKYRGLSNRIEAIKAAVLMI